MDIQANAPAALPPTPDGVRASRFELPAATGGGWLSVRESGQPGQPLLVFLHGFPEAAFAWDGLLQRLGTHFHAVAPNLRGYADSHAPADVKAYRAQAVLADVMALIAHHGGQAHAVIAHDWGGALAWGLAALAPGLMKQLVILNAPHPALFLQALRDDPAQQAASDYMNLLRQPGIEAHLAADGHRRMFGFFERFGGAQWLTPAKRAQYSAVWSHTPQAADGTEPASHGLTGPLNYYRASPLHPPTSPDDAIHTLSLPATLTQVSVPTHVLWGEADTALPPSLLDGLDEHVHNLRITRLPGLTHWLVHEDPARVGEVLEGVLRPATPT